MTVLRDDYSGKGKYGLIAQALNRLGAWVNHFRVAPPLLLREQNGSLALGVDATAMAGQILAELQYPFQITVDGEGNYTMQGARVNTGQSMLSMSGSSGTMPTGTHYWWVYLRFPNGNSSPTAEIRSGSAIPDADYETDDYPNGDSCESITPNGWAEVVIPAAVSVGGIVTQYLCSDLYVPRGQTVSVSRVVDHHWDDSTLKHIKVTEIYVNGVLRTVTGPSCEEVLATEDCPED